MTMWRCCSECSIPRAGALEQLGLQEEKEVEVGETRPDYIHTHTPEHGLTPVCVCTAIFIQALQWLPFILLLTICSRLRDSESRTELKLTTTS